MLTNSLQDVCWQKQGCYCEQKAFEYLKISWVLISFFDLLRWCRLTWLFTHSFTKDFASFFLFLWFITCRIHIIDSRWCLLFLRDRLLFSRSRFWFHWYEFFLCIFLSFLFLVLNWLNLMTFWFRFIFDFSWWRMVIFLSH